ncbi:MAG: ATP-binding protein [Phycisphaerales bacterium]|nr:ATP-binding protein [Phycisphaerales bacterium]
MTNKTGGPPPWTRVTILLVSLVALAALARLITGAYLPSGTKASLIFQNALLLVVLGSALLEHRFTKPADSAVNGLMGAITLLPVYGFQTNATWWVVFLYCALVFMMATICVTVSSAATVTGWRKRLADITYRPAVVLGKSRLLFSIVFLYGVTSFYGTHSDQTAILVLFWGVFIAIWPLGLPDLLAALSTSKAGAAAVGKVVRTDAPNIIHAELRSRTNWNQSSVKLLQQGDGKQRYVVPLFSQAKDDQILGTGLCCEADVKNYISGLEPGYLYERPSGKNSIDCPLGDKDGSTLVGFVERESKIGGIRFQVWDPKACREGMLVWSNVGDARVYYQITDGCTEEEGLETDKHGYQVATASQLGALPSDKSDSVKGFEKFPWLPAMNAPVFAATDGFGKDMVNIGVADFNYGYVPGTALGVAGSFADALEYHTAILGVTGAGKTELAFGLLRHAIEQGTKVICIDLTAKYEGRLSDLKPFNLSVSPESSAALGQKISEVETGTYGAPTEKKALKEHAGKLRTDVENHLTDFLKSKEDDKKLGIITLNEISNSKATLFITELYMTCLLNFARDKPDECPRVLLVVEEAHTVMPEPSTMGLGDFDSRGLVAKIAQIALQGRKYHVGLLVIAQRTATVSKTVLTQCNTIISFSCFDDTSLGFLQNFFGKAHTESIPNLQFLQAVIFGKGVNSQRPIIVQIPFDQKKKEASAQ